MKSSSSAAITTTIVATVGSPRTRRARAIARAKHDGQRDERDRRADSRTTAPLVPGDEARRRSPTPRPSAARCRAVPTRRTSRQRRDDERAERTRQRSGHIGVRRPEHARTAPTAPPVPPHGTNGKREPARRPPRPRVARSRDVGTKTARASAGAAAAITDGPSSRYDPGLPGDALLRHGVTSAASRLPCPTSSAGACARPTSRTSRSRS